MLSRRIHSFLFTQTIRSVQSLRPEPHLLLWLGLSLIVALMYDGIILREAFANPYVVQDDARQHVFWMRRFLDSSLFPQDLIADYFQSVAPWGYTSLYQGFAAIGIDPLLLSKLLPSLLSLLSVGYGFLLCLKLFPVPFAGFISTLLLNQILWGHDDIASASPRAFMPPLFLAFLYYLLQRNHVRWLTRSLLPCLGAIALEGIFYPQYVFVFAGIVALLPLRWEAGRVRLSKQRRDYGFWMAGLIVAVVVLLPFALKTSGYGPVITAVEARQLPDFFPGGRSQFFSDNPFFFWLMGNRSGLLPTVKPVLLVMGLLLPLLLRFPQRFPLGRFVSAQIDLLPRITLVAVGLFLLAHAVLFKLHLPSRYSAYSLRFVLMLAAAISLTILLEAGLTWLSQPRAGLGRGLMGGAIALGSLLLLFAPFSPDGLKPNYAVGPTPQIYQFLRQQPHDTVVASLLREADYIPTFGERSLFVGREYAIPYHIGYANPFRQRVLDLIRAQYSLEPKVVADFIQTHSVDFWLINRDSFTPAALSKTWIRQYPAAIRTAQKHLNRQPVLARIQARCTVVKEKEFILLNAPCLQQEAREIRRPSDHSGSRTP